MPAPTPAERQRTLAGLSTLSKRELADIWRKLNLSDPANLTEPLSQILADIVQRYGSAAAALAADWYDESRDAARTPGSYAATVAEPVPDQRLEVLARWGVGPLFGADANPAGALSLLTGGLQRLVLDQARETTEQSVALDPGKPTYARHASANACAFCALMASRGAVYTSAASAGTVVGRGRSLSTNVGRKTGRAAGGVTERGVQSLGRKYHDDCHCVVVEVFPGQDFTEAPYVQKWRDAYRDSAVTSGRYGAIDPAATLANMRKVLGTS